MADLFVSDARRGRIVLLSGDSIADEYGSLGSGTDQFTDPVAVARAPDGALVIADRGNDRIVRVEDFGGGNWQTLGVAGPGEGELRRPTGVAVDVLGRIWIADAGNRRIVRVDDIGGSSWETFGVPGTPTASDPAVGAFTDPAAVHVMPDGRVLIADPGAGRVIRVDDIDGSGWTTSTFGALRAPTSIATVETAGETLVLVAEFAARRVALLDANLQVRRASTDPRLNGPAAVCLADGELVALVPPFRTVATLADDGTQIVVSSEVRLGPLGIERPVSIAPVNPPPTAEATA
jgi:sugar lactone lactonase YvrE